MKDLVLVRTFRTRLEAETAGGLLTAAGIPFLIQSAEASGYGPSPQGASLRVRADQATAARRVLAEGGITKDEA